MLKRGFIFGFIFLCVLNSVYSQKEPLDGIDEKVANLYGFEKKKVHYGFYLGINSNRYKIRALRATITRGIGFQAGLLTGLQFFRFFSIVTDPGLSITMNTLNLGKEKINLLKTCLYTPLHLRINSPRVNNMEAYVQLGASYNYNLTAKNNIGTEYNQLDFMIRKQFIMIECGIGMSFYFPYFKFTPSFKAVYGIQNEFIPIGELVKNSLASFKSRGVFLNFIFQ